MLNKEDVELLEKVVNIADNLLTEVCEFKDEYVLTKEEIEDLEDEEEKEYYQDLLNTENTIGKAHDLIKKLESEVK